MRKKERKYIYISNLNFDGTVAQTQVLDWLHLYKEYELVFSLIQIFPVKYLKRPAFIRNQLKGIRKNTKLFEGYMYLLPSRGILFKINSLIIFFKIFKYLINYKEVLIFSRAIIGNEIAFLRRISPARIIYYFDARAAAAEEQKYLALKNHDFSLKRYNIIAHIYYLLYKTLYEADKVFVVSRGLQRYFQDLYLTDFNKFILYPCLSDSNKFYLNNEARNRVRTSLGIGNGTNVFIYSGAFGDDWHISNKMFEFIDNLFKKKINSLLICLTIEIEPVKKMLHNFPDLKPRTMVFSVPNNIVFEYLNAADYAILFRENTIMNNVASPTKFAEYILCGLPVLISEGVGDYSDFTVEYDLGLLIKESELNNPVTFDAEKLSKNNFNRQYIANIGEGYLSKESSINSIISELKS
ncbi:MAG: hypothetical protein JXB49_11085 [Bacteroidales bacterium]|nr:hypothetical protein [Bacteroidales bacterium]